MITATLAYPAVKSDRPTASALGIDVTHRTPIYALCRKLDEAGHGAEPLRVVNAATGSCLMEIRTVADGAKLTVTENDKLGPREGKYTPFEKSPWRDNG